MKKMLLLVVFCFAASAASGPAQAQHLPVAGTPTAVIQGVTVIAQAEASPAGEYLVLLERDPAQGWIAFYVSNPEYPKMPDSVKTPAGAVAYIEAHRAEMNAALARRFPVAGAPPTSTGVATIDALNSALASSFVFQVAPNGTATLAPR